MKRENWKYIILGIGLGFLIVAGVLLKFGDKEKESLTEKEIIEKARDLGMVFLKETIPPEEAKPKNIPEMLPQEKASQLKEIGSNNESDKSETVNKNDVNSVSKEESGMVTKVATGSTVNISSLLSLKDSDHSEMSEFF